jgi:hypothetical protein
MASTRRRFQRKQSNKEGQGRENIERAGGSAKKETFSFVLFQKELSGI